MAATTTETFSRDNSPELEAVQQLEEAARFLDLEKWIVQRLRYCERDTHVYLHAANDAGEPRVFRASRVQHASVRGPAMGPLLFSRHYTSSDLHAIAMSLTWQWALWQFPFSGSAGCISADIDELSEREARTLTRQYVDHLRGTIGPQIDVIAPARDSHPEVMAWALSALGSADLRSLAAITGKPVSVGGVDALGIAARFFRALFACSIKQYGKIAERASVAFVGFDALARRMALELERSGSRVIAIADRSGCVHDSSGLDITSLVQYAEGEKVVFGYPQADAITMADLLDQSCDALILCAPEGLSERPAARVIFEAGGELHCDVPKSLPVIPSLLADFSLSFASFSEWRKNSCGGLVEIDGLRGLTVHVRNTWREVHEYAERHSLSLHRAATTLAVSRVAAAMRLK